MNNTSKGEPAVSGERDKMPVTMADFIRFNERSSTTTTAAATTTRSTTKPPTRTVVDNNATTKPPKNLSYSVQATKKGNVPCVVESRKHHKVIVLSNIKGDADALLSVLKKKLGTGGLRKGSTIEISGSGDKQVETIKRFCVESGCLEGASKQTKGAIAEAASKGAKGTGSKKPRDEGVGPKPKTAAAINPAILLTSKEIKAMKPNTMKEHLAARQLSTQGNKKELIARLLSASAPRTT
mmetsp:Transcript_17153/g.37518  ORF Transcript_17153/g.37518 Transcript_17153/m.37518 type:complete len:239 (-) Transcript_17153:251-967(-)